MFKLQNSMYMDGSVKVSAAVIRLADMACIPFDPANTDYQTFLKYQAEGGKVYGADEKVPDGQAA